jgi:transcriptional regulator with XRE-family HTH domain
MTENHSYHIGHNSPGENMPKRIKHHDEPDDFGQRLTHLREAAGFTQHALALAVNVSQRMIAYYETENGNPPVALLKKLARALKISTDQLLGLEKVTSKNRPRDTSLWRRFTQIEKLPPQARRQVTQYLDTVLAAWKAQHGKS